MSLQIEEKPETSSESAKLASNNTWVVLVLRVVAFLATASATIVMALNKQTKTLVVATFGTTSVKATLTAKFQDNPAFVFFVIANALVSLHNLLMIAVNSFPHKFDYKGLGLVMVAVLDMVNVAVVSGAVSAALFMADLGKNGNKHARWDKICDKFEVFCNHGGGAIIASFVGLALMLIISSISITKLVKPKSTHLQLVQP